LQTPASVAQSVQELTIALQRTGDPANLNRLRPHLELLANIDPSPGKSRCFAGLEVGRPKEITSSSLARGALRVLRDKTVFLK